MSEGAERDGDALPQARTVRGRWPGLVWALPLAALIVVGYLGIRALYRRGVEATVTFGYTEGVTPGDTKVLVNGVEAGKVSRVRVSADRKHVDVTLRLDPREQGSLNSATKFWLIGENPTITDIQSIRAAVAGVLIAMAPGEGGTPTRRFVGLDSPPIIPPGTKGTAYALEADKVGSIQAGASLVYHGYAIGKVTDVAYAGPGRFRFGLFVQAPFDRFVRPGAEFWAGSPLKFSLSGGSLSAGITSPSSLLQGAVQFEPPAGAGPAAPAGTVFPLFDSQAEAALGATGDGLPYRLAVPGAVGDMAAGAPVTMLGYPVGTVDDVRLRYDGRGRPFTEAMLRLYPRRLNAGGDDRASGDAAVRRLLALGYRAAVTQSPPFVGAHVVSLAPTPHAPPATLAYAGGVPTIPLAPGGGDLAAKAGSILDKVDAMPLAEIGANVRRLTGNLARLTGSPELADGLRHLDATLAQVDRITKAAEPQVGPLLRRLNQTAAELQGTAAAANALLSGQGAPQGTGLPEAVGQLNAMARSIRELTDYLGRHPEALLRGKAKEKSQ